MWSALVNGSGLHGGGGGAGGGYVPSQGWEFVPCAGMDRAERGRGSGRSPPRRISSPPAAFTQLCEPHELGAPPGRGDGEPPGTQLEILDGQMWPRPEPPQQPQPPQTQHTTRLKRKFDELKKRHVQDKEDWMREKESLLREVADIQGGENRRILLDLRTDLEEVQVEVKREEAKRSELQLQYTRDRCAWELEKAELKCRIAQLEVKEGTGSVSGGVQSAVGPRPVESRSAQGHHGESPTLRRDREEQRRLLADTHSTAMDLRCRLEHNERDWSREKAELLERFDVERREWESQLKDMQRKIEELYCEVRTKRGGTRLDSGRQDDDDVMHRLSIRSTSTGSSLLSDNSRSEPLSSSSQSEPHRRRSLPGFGHNRNISGGGSVGREVLQHTWFQADSLCEFNTGGQSTRNDHSQPELVAELRSRGIWQQDSVDDQKDAADTRELAAIFHGAPGCGLPQKDAYSWNENDVRVGPQESPVWAELSCGSEKKKNTTALNAALKEIARVSEELCSYQDEIRKKSGDKRNQPESLCLTEESEMLLGHDESQLEVDKTPCDLSQIYDDLRALERENWITLSPDNTWQANRALSESWRTSAADPHSLGDAQTSPGIISEIDTAAPPIPPRTSSWNLSTPTHPDAELHIPESPVTTVKKCHSPCVLVDRKCSSPSIVRKFGAMLQENEGKVFVDGTVGSCPVPTNSNCNMGCCHNRWSCDASKFSSSKLSACGTVQKSFSEVNILSAGKDFHSDYSPGVGHIKDPDLQMAPLVKELPVDLLLSSLEMTPASPNLQGSRKNTMLEQKTAEFNRTLFQAEMGRGVKEQDGFTVTDASSLGCLAVRTASDEVSAPRETLQPHCSNFTMSSVHGSQEVTSCPSTFDFTMQNPDVQSRRMTCGLEGQEARVKQETPSDVALEQPQVGPREATTIIPQSPVRHPEPKHKVQTASSPSRKTRQRAATEALVSEHAHELPGHNVEGSSSKNGAKAQPARVGVSLQQSPVENKQRQMTQPRHAPVPPSQTDSSRQGPRMMNDHPWKPLTLAAYPRPEGSRSNYGAVERILKNYESAARAQQSQCQPNDTASTNLSVGQEENVTELDMLDMDPLPLPPTLRHTKTSHTSHTHTTHSQLSCHTAMGVKEIQLLVQGQEDYRWNT
uniref:MTCL family member 3a n=1 Tax=Scophthalmus maximus TaxID=52904 RepID=A0A8D2ZZY5_SCOMX